MKFEFVSRKKGNHRLVLIFAGWSTDPDFYRHISLEGWDVLVVWNYTDFDFDRSLVSDYTTIYLYAWSLGVFAASRALQDVRLAAAFAINGTRSPVDDMNGIPEQIYTGTIEHLDEANLKKFQRRMFSSSAEYEKILPRLPKDFDISGLALQLRRVKEESETPKNGKFRWTRVYISVNDRIFPYKNQLNAWRGVLQPVMLQESPHYVDLDYIIKTTIPDINNIGLTFSKAVSSYDENALAQRSICATITRLLSNTELKLHGKTLEIGAGTGIFTHMYGPLLIPSEAHFMDLYGTRLYGIAPIESHAIADAEEAFETTPQSLKWDYILSSNTIQWFRDPIRFFHNAYNYLEPGGWLVCTTFIGGTLSHFDRLRPSPIIYRDKHELIDELKKIYKEVYTFEDELKVYFDTPRKALMHLKYTGVNPQYAGLSNFDGNQVSLTQLLSAVPKDKEGRYYFTYLPFYILARRD